jgi:hypothetical protein
MYEADTTTRRFIKGVFCDADAVGEGLLTGFLPSQTHLVNGKLCLGGALGGVESYEADTSTAVLSIVAYYVALP